MGKALAFGLFWLAGAAGCAGAGAPATTQAALDRAFAQIQVHEAAVARARALIARADTPCDEACSAASGADRAQAGICRIATQIADADALARCHDARHSAGGLAAQAARRCACTR